MCSDACNVYVSAGPIEATALGNVAVQFMSAGAIKDIKEARTIIKDSFDVKEYYPQNPQEWDNAYEEYKKYLVK